ncbi:hypothetical protein D3C87_1777080 [compost metagenome]
MLAQCVSDASKCLGLASVCGRFGRKEQSVFVQRIEVGYGKFNKILVPAEEEQGSDV